MYVVFLPGAVEGGFGAVADAAAFSAAAFFSFFRAILRATSFAADDVLYEAAAAGEGFGAAGLTGSGSRCLGVLYPPEKPKFPKPPMP